MMYRFADAALNEVSATPKYADAAQSIELQRLKKDLDSGKLKDVRDTPEWWKVYTSIEIDFILNYKEASAKARNNKRRTHEKARKA